jgi:HK97 family phage prohead protease
MAMRRRSSLLGTEERRGLTLAASGCEVRADGEDGAKRFVGHAAVFDSRTAIGNPLTWGFYEEIAPGAFTKTLSEGDARFLIDHDSYYVVSRVSADTLSLAQDKTGLAVDSALDMDLSYVGDLVVNLRNKNITGMSFGFYVIKDEWNVETVELSDGNTADVEIRRILEVRLIEVSAVTFPAYEETDAGLRHSIVPALRHRGDPAAIERLARHRPELAELLSDIRTEPGESTRKQDSTTTDESTEGSEPGASTRNDLAPSVKARMRARALRYGLPAA